MTIGVFMGWPATACAEVCDKLSAGLEPVEVLFCIGLGLLGALLGRRWPVAGLLMALLCIGGSLLLIDWSVHEHAVAEGCTDALFSPLTGGFIAGALSAAGASWGLLAARLRSRRRRRSS